MRTCPKIVLENRKNAKMNSSTQKYLTLKNVWKIIFEKLMQKLTYFLAFYVESTNKKVFSMESVWKMVYLKGKKNQYKKKFKMVSVNLNYSIGHICRYRKFYFNSIGKKC